MKLYCTTIGIRLQDYGYCTVLVGYNPSTNEIDIISSGNGLLKNDVYMPKKLTARPLNKNDDVKRMLTQQKIKINQGAFKFILDTTLKKILELGNHYSDRSPFQTLVVVPNPPVTITYQLSEFITIETSEQWDLVS